MSHISEAQMLAQAPVKPSEKYTIPSPTAKMSASEAFTHGVAHGGALGFDDKAAGLVSGMLGARPDWMGGNNKGFSANYKEGSGAAQADNQQAGDQHPLAYGVGEVAGSVPLYAAGAGLGASGARAVGAFPVVGRLLGAGAVGATQGAGETGTAKGAGVGAALSMAGEGVGAAVGKGVKALANKGADIAGAEDVQATGKELASRSPDSIAAASAAKVSNLKQSLNDLLTDWNTRNPGAKPVLKDGQLQAPDNMNYDDKAFNDLNDQVTKINDEIKVNQKIAQDPSEMFKSTQSAGQDISKGGSAARESAIAGLGKSFLGRSAAGLAPAYIGSQMTPEHPWLGALAGESLGFGAPEIVAGAAKGANVIDKISPSGTADALKSVGTSSTNPSNFESINAIVNPSGQRELSDEERIAYSKMNGSSAQGRAQNNPNSPLHDD